MGSLFERKVTKSGNTRKTVTQNQRTGKRSTSYKTTKPKTSNQKRK